MSANDGHYTIAGLPEGSCSASMGLNGGPLTAATLTITPTDATQGIAVPYTAVRGFTVSSLGGVEPSAQMEFLDETNSTIIPVTSAADGAFLVHPLLAGN